MARPAAFVAKAAIDDTAAETFDLRAQKTMYGGRTIATGDTIFLFASETEGGRGLFARGTVTATRAVARKPGVARQTPRMDVAVKVTGRATRHLGRAELRDFRGGDGAEAELDFKLYRQATNKVVGVTETAASFLEGLF